MIDDWWLMIDDWWLMMMMMIDDDDDFNPGDLLPPTSGKGLTPVVSM